VCDVHIGNLIHVVGFLALTFHLRVMVLFEGVPTDLGEAEDVSIAGGLDADCEGFAMVARRM
jgi:hypothetical protein